MATKMLLGLYVSLCLASACSAGLLRVPKVYNAIISSSDNLTPSRAFPLIQPVVHETALGYGPLGPVVYHQPSSIGQPLEAGGYGPNSQEKDFRQEPSPKSIETPKADVSPPNKDEKAGEGSPANSPASENPLKLNEHGLPPSLVPVQKYTPPKVTYQFDPYSPYNPYYSDPYGGVLLPYGSPYGNPYSPYYQPAFAPNLYNPYLLPSPFYNFPTSGEQPGPQWSGPEQPWGGPLQGMPQLPPLGPEPAPGGPGQAPSQAQSAPEQEQRQRPADQQQPPPELNIKNNANKNSAIPDVPPPPLPAGGLKYDSDKKSS